MKWDNLLSSNRYGMEGLTEEKKHDRTEFQRDYDRLIFSAPFRRLQNKTQVFPLPGSVFVHNRLTHSLEVSCVGRSLGNNVGKVLKDKYKDESWRKMFYECGSIVAAACLAHDLGNPPFGHSGERAISSYFSEGNGKEFRQKNITDAEWEDFIHFEGNANSFRLLAHQFKGRRKGGFALTYSTLATIIKYPYPSGQSGKKGKFGFFQSEREAFQVIANQLGLICLNEQEMRFARHPLVYLVEAADDICYQIMDIEDAHKLKILTTDETINLLTGFFEGDRLARINRTMNYVEDVNEKVSYLRSSVIGLLVDECAQYFIENEEPILEGKLDGELIDHISKTPAHAYQECSRTAYARIYHSPEVIDIELAGYQIISTLLDKLLYSVFNPDEAYSKLFLNRVPMQYDMSASSDYEKIQAVLDYISGMTDVYALDLYRKINGMSLPVL
ncbi:MAG: deoxyguanosinetriphosphate triphosphohydrolase [Bacteroidales bacterium]